MNDDDEACECCGAVGVEYLMGYDENRDIRWMCEHCLRNTGQWEQAVEASAQMARDRLERDVTCWVCETRMKQWYYLERHLTESPRCTRAKPESALDVLLIPTVSLTHEEDGAP